MTKPQISIIMGSDSDLAVMSAAATILEEFNVAYELTIVSAHRTPDRMYEYAKGAPSQGIKVIITGAGGAAHLPGMVAALTALPVIGVPIQTKTMNGLDSLYSIVQMPPGVPVATVAINGAKNAALLACKILGISDTLIMNKVEEYQKKQNDEVLKKAERLEKEGYKLYLESIKK